MDVVLAAAAAAAPSSATSSSESLSSSTWPGKHQKNSGSIPSDESTTVTSADGYIGRRFLTQERKFEPETAPVTAKHDRQFVQYFRLKQHHPTTTTAAADRRQVSASTTGSRRLAGCVHSRIHRTKNVERQTLKKQPIIVTLVHSPAPRLVRPVAPASSPPFTPLPLLPSVLP